MGIEAITIDKYEHLARYAQPIQVPNRKMVGREKEMREIKAAMYRPELCNVLLLGEAGSGKACDNNTLVPVADDRGYVPIGEIKVGDFVFDENGQPTEVLGVFPQGLKDAYRVEFADGSSVVCNDEHLWGARKRYGHYQGYSFDAYTLRDMLDYGIVHVRSGKRAGTRLFNWYVPCNNAVERDIRTYSIHPYALGALIGDGALTNQQLCMSSQDEFVVNKVAELIGAVSVERNQCNYSWLFVRPDAKPSLRFFQTHEFEKLLPGVNVFGCKSVDRRIPRDYFLGSVEQRFDLLHGLMDTDGHVSRDDRVNCSFSTNSLGLAEDVRELAASLGIRTTLSSQLRSDDIHVNEEYEVHFSLSDDDKCLLFTLPRQLEKLEAYRRTDRKFNKHYDDICITDVKYLHEQVPMTCLYVAAESHLFQIGKAHIVTHNTMLVQSTMMSDQGKLYLEVDLAKMVADCETDVNQMASKLKSLFDDAMKYVKEEKQELVLFMDEFHQVVQLSDAAVEALKPLLADSGVRGIRVITATTPVEFRRHISPNQPLVERLQRINLAQTDKETTISILKGMAERYGVADQIYNDAIYESIYEYTNRYIPANAQPRKSILIMDAMIGWHRSEGRKIDKYLLADVIYESEGVNVAFKVDASKIKARLDKKVLSQKFATQVIEQRLQLCVADLNNKGRPMSSFLFSGSSGSGKSLQNGTLIPVADERGYVNVEDIQVGDYVFDEYGKSVKVLGVYPQGLKHAYEVIFDDGTKVICNDEHLWNVRTEDTDFETLTLKSICENGLMDGDSYKWKIPHNGPVARNDKLYAVKPSDFGVVLRDAMSDRVPYEYLLGSVEQRQELFDSLFTDKLFVTYSYDLAMDVRDLANSLGIRLQIDRDSGMYLLRYVARHDDDLSIVDVVDLQEDVEMTCLYVDSESHLFQATKSHIVTHNTEMVKSLAEILFDDDRSLLRFDCTEYANAESLERFRRELTARAWEHPHSIILLDEIEKACSPVTRLLLQVLDDGRLIDENNREVSFTNAYIVMTTNAGSEIYRTIAQYAADDDGSGKSMSRYDKLIRNSISTTTGDNRFPPELLGRIDCIVPFQPLSEQTMKDIARMKLQKLRREVLQRHGIKVVVQEKVIRYLVEDNLDTDSDSGGARTVVSKLESEVTTKIAKFINENPGIYKIKVSVEGTLAADDVNKLLSDAYIQVSAAL